jgi:hypothetical protein
MNGLKYRGSDGSFNIDAVTRAVKNISIPFDFDAATKAVENLNIVFEKLNGTKTFICNDVLKPALERFLHPTLQEYDNKRILALHTIKTECEGLAPEIKFSAFYCYQTVLRKVKQFYKYFNAENAPDNENSIWAPIVDQCNKTIELFTNRSTTELFTNESTTELFTNGSTTELFTNESTTELPIQQIEYFYVMIGVPSAVLTLALLWKCGQYCYLKHKETNYTTIIDINTNNVTTGLLTEEESEISAAGTSAAEISAAEISAAEISAEALLDEVLVNA